jgi:hypothetical protein
MHNITRLIILCIVLLSSSFAHAGNTGNDADTIHKDDVYLGRKPIHNFTIDGSFQSLIYARDFNTLFDGKQSQQKLVIGNNDGGEYRQMRLNFSGRPTTNTFFKTDMYIAPGMQGFGYNTSDKIGIEIGVNLEGQINTGNGNLFFKFGGTQFTKLSKLTLWSTENKGESMFERSPWGGFQPAGTNYETYYSAGTMSRDFTWGNKFIQGFSADLTRLPYGLESKFVFAKTPNNGGQTSYSKTIPDMSYGGIIRKNFGLNYIGINTFNAISKNDSINGRMIGYNDLTGDFSVTFLKKDMTLNGEVGNCQYHYIASDLSIQQSNGKAADFTLLSRHIAIKAPLTLHYFYIQPKYVNLEAGYNTFLQNAASSFNGQGANVSPVGAYMSDVDLINGNRQGGDLRTELNIHGLKVNFAAGMSKEVDHLTNVLSYSHRINNIMFARVYAYQTGMGPAASMNTTYRSYYETSSINTADSNYKNNRLNFSVMECNLKYKLNLFNKPVYMFYLTSFTSAQDFASATPVLTNKAYMRVQYHELEAYYKIMNKLALATYLGLETMKGNSMMQLGTNGTGKPTNVLGRGVGVGFDYDVSDVANFYVRSRWFDYNDKNNTYYQYKGFETTLELRIYF